MRYLSTNLYCLGSIKSLCPDDAIWRRKSWSSLNQVTNPLPKQMFINMVVYHSFRGDVYLNTQDMTPQVKIQTFGITASSHRRVNWYHWRNHLELYSLSVRTSYRKISRNLEAPRFGLNNFQSLWNLTGTSAASLSSCLSKCRAMRSL